jgi:hypothetical protein
LSQSKLIRLHFQPSPQYLFPPNGSLYVVKVFLVHNFWLRSGTSCGSHLSCSLEASGLDQGVSPRFWCRCKCCSSKWVCFYSTVFDLPREETPIWRRYSWVSVCHPETFRPGRNEF